MRAGAAGPQRIMGNGRVTLRMVVSVLVGGSLARLSSGGGAKLRLQGVASRGLRKVTATPITTGGVTLTTFIYRRLKVKTTEDRI